MNDQERDDLLLIISLTVVVLSFVLNYYLVVRASESPRSDSPATVRPETPRAIGRELNMSKFARLILKIETLELLIKEPNISIDTCRSRLNTLVSLQQSINKKIPPELNLRIENITAAVEYKENQMKKACCVIL